jgi:DNA-binding MarR family transcriptional regulator
VIEEAPASDAAQDDETTRELLKLVDNLVGRVWGHFQARVAELDLSVPEGKALQALEPGQAVSMRELARQLHANPSNVTIVVARLEGRGLVTRQGVDDRRVRSVRLSDAGIAARRQLEDRLLEGHPAVRSLSPAQQDALRRILRNLDRQPA